MASFKTKDPKETSVTIPCATILFRDSNPDADTFDLAIKYLEKRCKEEFGVDIINKSKQIEGMADFDGALQTMIKMNWNIILHSCLFHYDQALNVHVNKELKPCYQKNGSSFDFEFYKYIRKYHALPLLPVNLVPIAWNTLAKLYKKITPLSYHNQCKRFILYHQSQWMRSASFIKDWNCYRSTTRTNNPLECRNSIINARFGSHPFLFDFVWKLSEWYADAASDYDQYKSHGTGNVKSKREILKEQVLNDLWDFIDQNQKTRDVLLFLEKASIALNSKTSEQTLRKLTRNSL